MITEEQVLRALKQVLDPELKINVVDLGLVYSTHVRDSHVEIALTLTTPACPLGGVLTGMVEAAVWRDVPGVDSVEVHLVWSPPWRPAMMSEEARDMLGWV